MNAFTRNLCLATVLALSLGVGTSMADDKSDNPSAGLNLGGSSDLKGYAGRFSHKLVTVDNGSFKPYDAAQLKDVKYFAFYYSASWCPPCRAFTPKLVSFYNEFKAKHPDFELIFVNHDQDANAMLAYMKGDDMKWPAVRFDDIDSTKANQYCGEGIPDLVLTDADGKVLADSFKGSDYRGPSTVIDDIKKIVQ